MIMQEWGNEYDNIDREMKDESGVCDFLCRKCVDPCIKSILGWLSFAEVFFGNMPITVAAVGLSWVTQGK